MAKRRCCVPFLVEAIQCMISLSNMFIFRLKSKRHREEHLAELRGKQLLCIKLTT